MKISFLVPAHNEEKFIFGCLKSLLKYKRPQDEIIVGLDACTDSTEFIAKALDVKCIKSKKNIGKHAMLDRLIKKAKGDIIIVHDADWIFIGEESLDSLVKYFKDKKVGGIANSFSFTFPNKEKGNIIYIGDAWCSHFLMEFKKKYYTIRNNEILYIDGEKMFFPFFLNIIRKKLITRAVTVADDLERVLTIIEKGYKIVIPEDKKIPHQKVTYKHISLPKLYIQKVRGHLARKQIKLNYNYNTSIRNFYIPMTIFIIREMLKIHSLKMVASIFVWMTITVLSYFHALIMYWATSLSSEKLWKLRIR